MDRACAEPRAAVNPGAIAAAGRYTQPKGRIGHDDLAALARRQNSEQAGYGSQEFQDWFAKMQPLVERGERELLQVVALSLACPAQRGSIMTTGISRSVFAWYSL